MLRKAKQVMDAIQLYEEVRSRMIGEQAMIFVQIRQWEQAKALINTIPYYWERDKAMCEVVNVLVQERESDTPYVNVGACP